MTGHIRLSSYHYDGNSDNRVEHEVGTFDPGPPRRYVFRWVQDGERGCVALTEQADGSFGGFLEYPGSSQSVVVLAAVATKGEHEWEIDLSMRGMGLSTQVGTICATAIRPKT